MQIDENGVMLISKNDVVTRHLIVLSEKFLNERANDWFRNYCTKIDTTGKGFVTTQDLIEKEKYIYNRLEKNYGFTKDDYDICFLQATSALTMLSDKYHSSFTIVSKDGGTKVVFDKFNGYWFTATKIGVEERLVLFDYGDFYCLGSVFPLATYFVKKTKELAKNDF